jgi:tRNA A37 N6-isopentenylltransferase MiaA
MGPTGSGKSKLAIDLAAHFPVEIINADSMQVYRGLDVLTNKVPISDQEGLFSFFFYMLIFVVLTSSLSKWRSFFYIMCNLQTSITAMNFLFFTYNNNKKS